MIPYKHLTIWPWDELAMERAIAMLAYWQENPSMPLLRWVWML